MQVIILNYSKEKKTHTQLHACIFECVAMDAETFSLDLRTVYVQKAAYDFWATAQKKKKELTRTLHVIYDKCMGATK